MRVEAELKDVRERLRGAESGLQEYESLNIDELRDAVEEIQRNLATQSELQEDIFSGLKTRVRTRPRQK